MSDTSRSGDVSYREVLASDAYKSLRSTFRNFAFPMTIAGLSSYFVFVLLSVFAPQAMGAMAFGNLTWGMLIGLAQFAVVWIWTAIYVQVANSRLDATAASLKLQLEEGGAA